MTRSPSVLLIQVRNPDDPMREHEVVCFATRAGIERHQVVAWDAVEAAPSLTDVRRHDAVMIGGSGEYNVSQRNQPGLEALFELLREIAVVGHPTFASCYGFQCLVAAHGGEIIFDPERTEVGTYALELTEAGKEDPLFGTTLSPSFDAQQGHKDRAIELPEGFANLARSERSPVQALRIPGKPIWAAQFHPELDHVGNRHRYEHYLAHYSAHMTDEERARALDRFRPTPETDQLLRAFLTLI